MAAPPTLSRIGISTALVLIACGREPQEIGDGAGAVATSAGAKAPTTAFFDGLAAEPGSPARIEAGKILEAQLHKSYKTFKKSEFLADEQELTKKILGFTVEYLKSDKSAACPPDKKIRLYRGFGPQLILHPKGEPKKAFHLFGEWARLVREDLGSALDGADDAGEFAFAKSAGLKRGAIDKLPWNELLGKRPGPGGSPDIEAEPIDLAWSLLAMSHTNGGDLSPLISTSIEPDVSGRFGPGYIVADVCPERAIPFTADRGFFNELEVYVPLFLLPEEIVRVEGRECGVAAAKEPESTRKQAKKSCFPKDFTDTDKRSPTGAIYQACYSNLGHVAEHGLDSVGTGPLADRYFDKIHDAMYDVLAKSTSIAEVRSHATKLGAVCQPSCETSAEILALVNEQVAKGCTGCSEEAAQNLQKIADDLPGYTKAVGDTCPSVR